MAAAEGHDRDWRVSLAVADTGDPKYVVSSPNMDYIPSPHVGIVQVCLRSDFRYGVTDPIQWPQLYTEEFAYLCTVLRRPAFTGHYSPIWWDPEENDFTLLEGSLFTCLGLLKQDAIRPLSDLVDKLSASVASISTPDSKLCLLESAMSQARDRLKYFPCTFRDTALQVRETQRYWLMARAQMDFDASVDAFEGRPQPVRTNLMGAFTTDPGIVRKLHNAGIPVWFIRSDVSAMQDPAVDAVVTPTLPTKICMDEGPEGGFVVYSGLAGADHIIQTVRLGHTYLDISRVPLLVVEDRGGYPAACSQKDYRGILAGGAPAASSAVPVSVVTGGNGGATRAKLKREQKSIPYSRPHPTQVRGVNKFDHLEHPWMPAELESWQDAFRNVDLTKPARPNSEVWGYWIPEPALLLRPKSADRRDRYVMTWLRLRSAWLYLLRVPDVAVTSVPTQWWRDVLYGHTGRIDLDPSKLNTQRWEDIRKVFGTVFQDIHFDSNVQDAPRWFHCRVRMLDQDICRKIIWEMFDLGFRYELLALDRLFVPVRGDHHAELKRDSILARVFPSNYIYSLTDLPSEGVGLYARIPHRRVPYLEGLRLVVSRWPSCPAAIHAAPSFSTAMPVAEVLVRERALVRYYVDTFFAQSGRAPIVPHEFPG